MTRLLACALLVALWPARAHACLPWAPVESRTIAPADGATGVPTNARIALDYQGGETQALADVIVRPLGGQAIGVTTQMGVTSYPARNLVFVRPTGPLAANTSFEILTRIPTVPCEREPCVAATYSVAAVFTTGSGPDTVAPSYGGLSSVAGGIQNCAGSYCCGPYRAILYTFQSSTPTDDAGLAGLNLYRVGSGLVSELTSLDGFEVCGGMLTGSGPPGLFIAPHGTFYAHAVDLAGNEDGNMQLVTVSVSCADAVDGGATAPDASLDAAAGSATPPSAGCGCTVAQRGDPSLLFLLALFALRRRR